MSHALVKEVATSCIKPSTLAVIYPCCCTQSLFKTAVLVAVTSCKIRHTGHILLKHLLALLD